jgi:hypothetical protein
MAVFLASKVAAEIVQRAYDVPVDKDDNAASVSFSSTGVTVTSSEFEDNKLLMTISGGTAGQTAAIVATVTTDEGRVLIETLYLPIIASASQIAQTAREYVGFALRRFIGNGEEATADEMFDGLERLSALVAEWRATGADIGAAFPIETDTVIYCPDWAVSALRYNLLVDCSNLYEATVTQSEYMMAMRGKALVKNMNVLDERVAEYF